LQGRLFQFFPLTQEGNNPAVLTQTVPPAEVASSLCGDSLYKERHQRHRQLSGYSVTLPREGDRSPNPIPKSYNTVLQQGKKN